MSGLLQGGPAVLFAVAMYGVFFALVGEQLRRVVVADESFAARLFGGLAVVVLSAVVWVLIGTVVFWTILLWFRFLLQEPHAWRQQIIDLTAWFPLGALLHTGAFSPGLASGLAVLIGYPASLGIAAGFVALWHRMRREAPTRAATGGIVTVLGTKRVEEGQ